MTNVVLGARNIAAQTEESLAKDKDKKKKKKGKKGGKGSDSVSSASAAVTRLKAISQNPRVAELVAQPWSRPRALRDTKRAQKLAANAEVELRELAKSGSKRGSELWQLALDVGRRSLEAVSGDEAKPKPRKARAAKRRSAKARKTPAVKAAKRAPAKTAKRAPAKTAKRAPASRQRTPAKKSPKGDSEEVTPSRRLTDAGLAPQLSTS